MLNAITYVAVGDKVGLDPISRGKTPKMPRPRRRRRREARRASTLRLRSHNKSPRSSTDHLIFAVTLRLPHHHGQPRRVSRMARPRQQSCRGQYDLVIVQTETVHSNRCRHQNFPLWDLRFRHSYSSFWLEKHTLPSLRWARNRRTCCARR